MALRKYRVFALSSYTSTDNFDGVLFYGATSSQPYGYVRLTGPSTYTITRSSTAPNWLKNANSPQLQDTLTLASETRGGLFKIDSVLATNRTEEFFSDPVICTDPLITPAARYGFYVRSGLGIPALNANTYGNIRQIVIKWDGQVVYDGGVTQDLINNGYIVAGGFKYYPGALKGIFGCLFPVGWFGPAGQDPNSNYGVSRQNVITDYKYRSSFANLLAQFIADTI
jgi:hypothetical protein